MKITNFLFSLSASCILLATCAQARVCFVVGGCDGDKKVATTKDCKSLGYTYTSCPGNQSPVSECKDNGTTYYRCSCDTSVYNLQEYPTSAYIQVLQADGTYISKINPAYKGKEMCGDNFRALCNDSYRYVDNETATGTVEFGKITSRCGANQEPDRSDYCTIISGEGKGTKLYKTCSTTCEYIYSENNVGNYALAGDSCQREENGKLVTYYEKIACPGIYMQGDMGIVAQDKPNNCEYFTPTITPDENLGAAVRNTSNLVCGRCDSWSTLCSGGYTKDDCVNLIKDGKKPGQMCRKDSRYADLDCYHLISGGNCPTPWYQDKQK